MPPFDGPAKNRLCAESPACVASEMAPVVRSTSTQATPWGSPGTIASSAAPGSTTIDGTTGTSSPAAGIGSASVAPAATSIGPATRPVRRSVPFETMVAPV